MAEELEPGRRPPPTPERRHERHESRTGSTYKAFLKDLCEIGKFDMEMAECAAVSVLCAFERRVFGEEARDLEAQLPLKLRELLVSCNIHAGKPSEKYGKDELFQIVAADLKKPVDQVEPIIRAVVAAVRNQISEGEFEDFSNMLPGDLKELWMLPI
ncbi:DUF2267 domain-containing protein [Vulgatibacter incomptus]|uniref:CBS domain pair protein n=1 Tax=Vulgatibacter incomptus TaxID=1391653 RepID=A0A0K1P9I7_9BACT|nr:DUF2267 domain-containing protein [Vulgatibacter incomptus]AKU90091.1 CBS domain pair protein [Vulgatibacter incomptus]